ncbi:MAG: hypothetical protein IJ873_04245, partial [Lachnospiraceae bacterium]|nr:hypothetical protein [Lachnospiraceae bacterium]
MRSKKIFTKLFAALLAVMLLFEPAAFKSTVYAAVIDYGNGIRFDAEYYAETYPELKALYGDDEAALLAHYLLAGTLEGRTAYAGQDPLEIENIKQVFTAIAQNSVSAGDTASETGTDPQVSAAESAQTQGTVEAAADQKITEVSADDAVADRAVTDAYGAVTESALEILPDTAPAALPPIDPAAVPGIVPQTGAPVQTSNGLVLVYLNGTDLESNNGSAKDLVNQAINASASGNTRFVIM